MKHPIIVIPNPIRPVLEEKLESRFPLVRPFKSAEPGGVTLPKVISGAAINGIGVDERFLDTYPDLEIVANFGVGYDNVDVSACARRGIVVTNTPDVLTEEVADTTIALLLMTIRRLSKAEQWLRSGNWKAHGPFEYTPLTLRGRRLGIFGLGRIGKAIAHRAKAFGLEIHYHGRHKQEGIGFPFHDTLESLAGACDTLVIAAPGGPETHHAIDMKVLEALGPDGVVINIGRGPTVDEAALATALKAGTIAAAGLDVFEHEPHVHPGLLDLDNVVLLPHVGSASVHTRDAMASLVADNLISWFETGRALTPVTETPNKA
ncbi:2-hydroxyacid dehydrogenase [Roseibium sp. RKSG952]|uniref:2-hydroxyacid dehydrogenase n=1 Tax=Roseibium sp. RKSG952 TaxID=2529384 RepID=UPI0012BD61DC|nr:2-hydroxyacid dehydrogenase [Roseibium sp. RKSG952]MTH96468.1 2-hydroxyacid dehydrogenase [Roseibium sp. RKSG952]